MAVGTKPLRGHPLWHPAQGLELQLFRAGRPFLRSAEVPLGKATRQVILCGSEFIRASLESRKCFKWVWRDECIYGNKYFALCQPLILSDCTFLSEMRWGRISSFKAWKDSSPLPVCTHVSVPLSSDVHICLWACVSILGLFSRTISPPRPLFCSGSCESVYLADNNNGSAFL